MLNWCWATSLFPELPSAFWKILTLTICALWFRILCIYWALLVLESNLALARLHSRPGKERELVPRCSCFCLQLFSVPENPFPCRCTNGTCIVSICLFDSVSPFVLVIRAFELWVPSKKESLCFLDLRMLWGQGRYNTKQLFILKNK